MGVSDSTPRMVTEDASPEKSLNTGVTIAYCPAGISKVPPPAAARAARALCKAGPSSVIPSPAGEKSLKLKVSPALVARDRDFALLPDVPNAVFELVKSTLSKVNETSKAVVEGNFFVMIPADELSV